jgi:hypothetical protein
LQFYLPSAELCQSSYRKPTKRLLRMWYNSWERRYRPGAKEESALFQCAAKEKTKSHDIFCFYCFGITHPSFEVSLRFHRNIKK